MSAHLASLADLKATFQLQILGVKKNPQSPMYTQLGVLTKGTVIEVNVSELGMVTAGGKVVFGKYAQITNNPENDGCINAVLCELSYCPVINSFADLFYSGLIPSSSRSCHLCNTMYPSSLHIYFSGIRLASRLYTSRISLDSNYPVPTTVCLRLSAWICTEDDLNSPRYLLKSVKSASFRRKCHASYHESPLRRWSWSQGPSFRS